MTAVNLSFLKQSKELANILSYYLDRSYRFKSISSSAYLKTKSFLSKLDDFTNPYHVTYKKHAFIFAMDQQGIDSRTLDGVSYHVVGKDKVEQFFQDAEKEFNHETENFDELTQEELQRTASFFFTKVEGLNRKKETSKAIEQETSTRGRNLGSEKDGESELIILIQ